MHELDYFSISLQVLNLSVDLHVLPPDFNIPYSLTYVLVLTRTYTFVNLTWCMEISSFQFKQLFNFVTDSPNTDIVFIINENVFIKRFENFSFFGQYGISNNTTSFENQEEECCCQFTLIFVGIYHWHCWYIYVDSQH